MTDPFSAPDESRPRAARRAEFARFHDEHYATLVGLLHALTGDRTHAHRVTQRAFTDAWLRWRAVRTLPDPAAWVRRRARHAAPPRRRPASRASGSGEWVAPLARPVFDALGELPEKQRVVLALHHIGGLTPEQIAAEEQIPLDAVSARLAHARQALAQQTGQAPAEPGNGEAEHQSVDAWASRGLADLTHALSYRTDRRAGEQVFRLAIRRRLAVLVAAVVLLTLVGAIGVLALTGGSRNAAAPPPVSGEPLASLPSGPPAIAPPGGPSAAPGQPEAPRPAPAGVVTPGVLAPGGPGTGERSTDADHDGDQGDHDSDRDHRVPNPGPDGARDPLRPKPVVNTTPRSNPGQGGAGNPGQTPGGSTGQPQAPNGGTANPGNGNNGGNGSGNNPRGPRTEQGGSDNDGDQGDRGGRGSDGRRDDNGRGGREGTSRGSSDGGDRGNSGGRPRGGGSDRGSDSGDHGSGR
ncbi:hypothetical protein GCM10023321_51150 [Pseudonocardia eucalypti]|uniref:RNA polymerase sigma factor 70 region 4 type 2 domain-containing protein n=1 Tax=Pseudonocardia eucalypti TaxID=648755 RepID=A0ABP9QLA2_9PSEU|nr:DNA-directed RNA polymerase specialized sigma24 family protein [Pseudonocardia eucalypti]